MKIERLPVGRIREAPWNPNVMDAQTLAKLRTSIERYGLVENLVVRPVGEGSYEVLGGNQRLKVICDLGVRVVPCAVVQLNDAQARLLAQALNNLRGDDDLGLKAKVVQDMLRSLTEEEVLAVLPQTTAQLAALRGLGQETMAAQIQGWERAQAARLHHLQFQLTAAQLEVVEEALAKVMQGANAGNSGNPNRRGLALYRLCADYLQAKRGE